MSAISRVDQVYFQMSNWGSRRSPELFIFLAICWVGGITVFVGPWLFPNHVAAAFKAAALAGGGSAWHVLFTHMFIRSAARRKVFARITSLILISAVPAIVAGALVWLLWDHQSLFAALTLPGGLAAAGGVLLFSAPLGSVWEK
jgi:hypothetical protein